MQIKLKKILGSLWISRQAFYKHSFKQEFVKTSRGVYEVDENFYTSLKKYYAAKKGISRKRFEPGMISESDKELIPTGENICESVLRNMSNEESI